MSDIQNQIFIQQDTPNQIIIDDDFPNRVVIQAGMAQGNTRRYVHTQASALSSWEINHTLGGRPSVTIVDSAGTVVTGEVTYNSNFQVTVEFTAPFSGYAYLT